MAMGPFTVEGLCGNHVSSCGPCHLMGYFRIRAWVETTMPLRPTSSLSAIASTTEKFYKAALDGVTWGLVLKIGVSEADSRYRPPFQVLKCRKDAFRLQCMRFQQENRASDRCFSFLRVVSRERLGVSLRFVYSPRTAGGDTTRGSPGSHPPGPEPRLGGVGSFW